MPDPVPGAKEVLLLLLLLRVLYLFGQNHCPGLSSLSHLYVVHPLCHSGPLPLPPGHFTPQEYSWHTTECVDL